MNWTLNEERKLKDLYLKKRLVFTEIENIMGRSVPAINARLVKLGVKRRNPSTFKVPFKITPALARIHAHLCGDGYLYNFREKDCYGPWAKYRKKIYRNRYFIAYTNNNQDLLKEFKKDIFFTFNVRGKRIHNNEVRVGSKRSYDFLKELGAGGSYKWYISEKITNGSKEIIRNWIRAFFDDEAYFNDGGRIRVKCVNKNGLIQVRDMLRNFVPCHITPKKGFYWGNTVCLNILKKDAPKYFKEIGSLRYKY